MQAENKAYLVGASAPIMRMLSWKGQLGVVSEIEIKKGDKIASPLDKSACFLYTVTAVTSTRDVSGRYPNQGFHGKAVYYMLNVEMETTFLSKLEIIDLTQEKLSA